jgi:hypothetical protein
LPDLFHQNFCLLIRIQIWLTLFPTLHPSFINRMLTSLRGTTPAIYSPRMVVLKCGP